MRNCLRVILVVALVLLSLVMLGGGTVSAASGSVGGYVRIEGTGDLLDGQGGRPLASVAVYDLSWTWRGHDNMGSGGYSIGGLATGDYYVYAQADGYYPEYYDNATTRGAAKKVSVTDTLPTLGIDLYLVPGKSITGTVYDNATNPISRAYVEVVDNNTSGVIWGATYSADNGSYSITVAPGTYKVRAMANGFATEYYDNTTAYASAAPVVLGTDQDTTGIDFSLGAMSSIAGQVFEDDNVTPLLGALVSAYDTAGGFKASGRASSDNGSYFINIAQSENTAVYYIVATAAGWVPQWWDEAYLASEPDNPLSYWGVADNVTVTRNQQTAGCNFRMLPKRAVSTAAASGVTAAAATLNGNLDALGYTEAGVSVSFRWGTDNTYAGGTTPAVPIAAPGPFSATLSSGLAQNSTYHFQAVASGDGLTVYGDDAIFVTAAVGAPAVTTGAESGVTLDSATLNANLDSLGTAANVTVFFQYGATAAYGSTTPEVTANATGAFSAPVTGLTANTNYHFRAVAVGEGATVYGADRGFTTLGTAPAVATDNAGAVGTASATLRGTLTSLGTEASVNVSFEWRTAGGTWTETIPVQALTAPGAYSAALTLLTSGTTYQFRAKADGYGDPVYGTEVSFTTTAIDSQGPVVSALAASGQTSSSATIEWTTDEPATSQVEYGLTEDYGRTTDEDTNLVTGHSVELTGLEAGKTYYYRVISKDAAGNETISAGTSLETKSGGGGVAGWVWAVVGVAAVAVVGGGAFLLFRGRAPKPQ